MLKSFLPANLIHAYTRAEALADGVLIDVSAMANFPGGFVIPVAITAAVQGELQTIPARLQGEQSIIGRTHDLLLGAAAAARKCRRCSTLMFEVELDVGRSSSRQFRMTVSPGDQGTPVITIMLPNED